MSRKGDNANETRAQRAASPLLVFLLAFVGGILGAALATFLVSMINSTTDGPKISELSSQLDEQYSILNEIRAELGALRTAGITSEQRENFAGRDPKSPSFEEPGSGRFDGYDELMRLEVDQTADIRAIPQQRLIEIFGRPATQLNDKECLEPTSPRLKAALTVEDVGPFRARLLTPAAESAKRVFERLQLEHPKLYEVLKSYGGFCARLIRGSSVRVSRHAFGLALDVSVGGTLDAMGDGRTQFGLILMATMFEEEGWVWGAGFRREDSMHFEVGLELFEQWVKEKRL